MASTEVAVFMDTANDGGDGACEELADIYNNSENKEVLLTYINERAEATALHLAANNGHDDIVEFLVKKII